MATVTFTLCMVLLVVGVHGACVFLADGVWQCEVNHYPPPSAMAVRLRVDCQSVGLGDILTAYKKMVRVSLRIDCEQVIYYTNIVVTY